MANKITYAVIQLGAKQYLVKVGDKVVAEKVDVKEGDTLKIKEVLLGYDGEKTRIGTPYLEKATVDLVMEGDKKGEKIRIAKYKAKSRYRKVSGHRQTESHFVVKAINL